MINSMTGFASGQGQAGRYGWAWDLRAVNGKGLDLRLRVPDWVEGLEAGLRKAVTARIGRGNVTCSLKLSREDDSGALVLNEGALARLIDTVKQVEMQAAAADLALGQTSAADLLAMRGVLDVAVADDDTAALAAALLKDFAPVLEAFCTARASEGAALQQIITAQIDRIEGLVDKAATLAEARKDQLADALRENLARVLDNVDGVDEARLTQELALLAVKSDVTEEIDRLHAHVAAARDLMTSGGVIGRKLDFLMQEFNREANTLCSKAQSTDLTALGLDLKATIDQMREQVQNVE